MVGARQRADSEGGAFAQICARVAWLPRLLVSAGRESRGSVAPAASSNRDGTKMEDGHCQRARRMERRRVRRDWSVPRSRTQEGAASSTWQKKNHCWATGHGLSAGRWTGWPRARARRSGNIRAAFVLERSQRLRWRNEDLPGFLRSTLGLRTQVVANANMQMKHAIAIAPQDIDVPSPGERIWSGIGRRSTFSFSCCEAAWRDEQEKLHQPPQQFTRRSPCTDGDTRAAIAARCQGHARPRPPKSQARRRSSGC